MKRIIFFSLFLALFCTAFTGCTKGAKDKKYEKDLFALDTYIKFTVYGDKENSQKALDAAVERLKEIENRLSISVEDSDVNLINVNAGKEPVKVSSDTLYVIKKALYYSQLTDGLFDITIYPLVRLWDIKSDNPRVPEHGEILDSLEYIDYKGVILDEENKTVLLEKEGMMIDLGGIAKGYIADETAKIIEDHGIEHAIINLGGNIKVVGKKPDNTNWRIGIQDPRDSGRSSVLVVEANDQTVVTSGDYERYMIEIYEETGERYHHIFDPYTGYPAKSGLISTTIIGDSSLDADALSTILFILGVDEGFKLIALIDNVDAVAINDNKEVYITKGLKDKLEVKNSDYKLID